MFWRRQTRSGNEFSPFCHLASGDVVVADIDIASALEAAVAREDRDLSSPLTSLASDVQYGPELSEDSDLPELTDSEREEEFEKKKPLGQMPTGFAPRFAHVGPSPTAFALPTSLPTNSAAGQKRKRSLTPELDVRDISQLSDVDEEVSLPPPPSDWSSNDVDDDISAPSTSHSSLPPPLRPSAKKARTKKYAHVKRAAARATETETNGGKPSLKTMKRIIARGKGNVVKTILPTDTLPCAHGGYTSILDDYYGKMKQRSVPELLKKGMRLLEWNGYDTIPITDIVGRVIACCVGQPRDGGYHQATHEAAELIIEGGKSEKWTAADKKTKREKKNAAAMYGIPYGKGQKVPKRLDKKTHGELLDNLVASAPIQRIAGFASTAFALWAPRTYDYYNRQLTTLYQQLPHLTPNFPLAHSIFPCYSFNFGPRVCCFKHRDNHNCPFGWCAITALGNFDPTKGGHLVLWDLNLVIEFPAGATILLPSATIAHSNIPVGKHETRVSFTQYCAGGLFRWVDNGFRTDKELAEQDPVMFEKMAELKGTRWKMGLNLFSSIDELVAKTV